MLQFTINQNENCNHIKKWGGNKRDTQTQSQQREKRSVTETFVSLPCVVASAVESSPERVTCSLRTFWGSAIMSDFWLSFPSEAPVIHLVPREKSKFKIYAFTVTAVLRWATELLSPEKSKIWCRNIIHPVIFANAWHFLAFATL